MIFFIENRFSRETFIVHLCDEADLFSALSSLFSFAQEANFLLSQEKVWKWNDDARAFHATMNGRNDSLDDEVV